MRDVFWLAEGGRLPLWQRLVELITPIAVPRGTKPLWIRPCFVQVGAWKLLQTVCSALWLGQLPMSQHKEGQDSLVASRSDLNAVSFEEVDKVFF